MDRSDSEVPPRKVFPKVNVSKLDFRSKPQGVPKNIKLTRTGFPSTSQAVARGVPTIEPFRYVEELQVPNDVMERDVLYVACQLLNRHEDESSVAYDRLTRTILIIAKNFKFTWQTKKTSLKTHCSTTNIM